MIVASSRTINCARLRTDRVHHRREFALRGSLPNETPQLDLANVVDECV